VERASSKTGQTSAAAYTSMFKWGKEREREGSAREVAAAIAGELDASWNEAHSLGLFDKGQLY
jgi:hypothetical protein